jgi:hypothetical protein
MPYLFLCRFGWRSFIEWLGLPRVLAAAEGNPKANQRAHGNQGTQQNKEVAFSIHLSAALGTPNHPDSPLFTAAIFARRAGEVKRAGGKVRVLRPEPRTTYPQICADLTLESMGISRKSVSDKGLSPAPGAR